MDLSSTKQFRKSLGKNKNYIEVTDFGAGSRVFKDNKRQVSAIAAKAGISMKRGKLLSKTLDYFKPDRILEIGTSLGIATAYMAATCPKAKIITLEGCPTVAGIAKEAFEAFQLNNIEVVTGEFSNTLADVLKNNQFDFIYFDGNHQKEPTLDYFEQCLAAAHKDSVFIFDDIHWTKDMEEAWEEIKNHKSVTLSLDTYKWGMVFFREGQVKQHFTLRI
jgi:predicted O-methyltransferase YrrM